MQLIRTADGVPIWGRSYHVARTDLLTIEEQVSRQVADALRAQLRTAGQGRQRMAPKNPAAYESYLQGRALLVNYSEVKMRAAIESFERALQLEPDYALARAGLATSLAWFSVRYAYQKDALYWGRRAEEEAYPGTGARPRPGGSAPGDRQCRWHGLRPVQLAAAAGRGGRSAEAGSDRSISRTRRARGPCITSGSSTGAGGGIKGDRAQSRRSTSKPSGCWWSCRCSAAASTTPGSGAEELATRRPTPRSIRMYLGQALFYLGQAGAGRGAARQHQTWRRARRPVAGSAGRRAGRNRAERRRAGNRRRPSSEAPRWITTSHTASAPRSRNSAVRAKRSPGCGQPSTTASPAILVRGGPAARADPPGSRHTSNSSRNCGPASKHPSPVRTIV